jgi:hypothetical protein
MRQTCLRVLTWGTVGAAVSSAVVLASTDAAAPGADIVAPEPLFELPLEPPAAGTPADQPVTTQQAPAPGASR